MQQQKKHNKRIELFERGISIYLSKTNDMMTFIKDFFFIISR